MSDQISVNTETLKYLLFKKGIIDKEECEAIQTAEKMLTVLIDKGVLETKDLEEHQEEAGELLQKVFASIEAGKRLNGGVA